MHTSWDRPKGIQAGIDQRALRLISSSGIEHTCTLYTHTHTRLPTHTHKSTHAPTHTHTSMHAHTPTKVCVHTHACTHTETHTHTHMSTHAHTVPYLVTNIVRLNSDVELAKKLSRLPDFKSCEEGMCTVGVCSWSNVHAAPSVYSRQILTFKTLSSAVNRV